ncbi:hypothetical protein CEK28_15630 [Xenophilus sp. AP218F]|uniref:Uncharacterized protein n=1 Tax=Chromobacterium amazonense TaxID=1382803 RepID=A0A2S9X8C4_9NEIS|nr:hypothetical protein [Chromobacterium amazonense]OWY37660.1 hypothetical protein CEK28_15630 [Xenophilus sp. AP218F]PRP71968.1 hypothetical protein BUE93_03480 [Chromobacterium amazonense]
MKNDLPPDQPLIGNPDKPAQAGFVVSGPRTAAHWASEYLHGLYRQYAHASDAKQMRNAERCMRALNITIPEL